MAALFFHLFLFGVLVLVYSYGRAVPPDVLGKLESISFFGLSGRSDEIKVLLSC